MARTLEEETQNNNYTSLKHLFKRIMRKKERRNKVLKTKRHHILAQSVLPTEKTAEIAIDYDGEILEEGLPVDISIVPEALNLIILRQTN